MRINIRRSRGQDLFFKYVYPSLHKIPDIGILMILPEI
jgi:hypothetical protein